MDQDREGWMTFAAVVLVIAGVMRIFDAIWAFHYHGALPEGLQGALFGQSLATYGWIYIVEAIVLILSGAGVVAGSQVSRWIGIIAASLACVSAIWLMPFFPLWSLLYILLGVLVIYALAAYGGERAPSHP